MGLDFRVNLAAGLAAGCESSANQAKRERYGEYLV